MGDKRMAGANGLRRGVPVTGALLAAAALVCGGGQAIGPAAAATTGRFYQRNMTTGDIYTIAGNGQSKFAGDGGPAAEAHLSAPADIALGGQGGLMIADTGHNRVRMVASKTGMFYGRAMTAGDIYTIAGDGSAGYGGDGGPAPAARLHRPTGVGLDHAGNVLIADSYNERIRVVAAKTGSFYGRAMTAGDIAPSPATAPRGSPATAPPPPRPS